MGLPDENTSVLSLPFIGLLKHLEKTSDRVYYGGIGVHPVKDAAFFSEATKRTSPERMQPYVQSTTVAVVMRFSLIQKGRARIDFSKTNNEVLYRKINLCLGAAYSVFNNKWYARYAIYLL